MSFSLNEIDALCRKAARGAGYGWGHAEDAGKAVRWLEARSIPGAELLLNCLDADTAATSIDMQGTDWRGARALCPILAGSCLSDNAASLRDGAVTLHDVSYPILLAPFAAGIAALTHRAVRLEWAGAQVIIGETLQTEGSTDALLTDLAKSVQCSLDDATASPEPSLNTRAVISRDTYARLDAFAQRTYAPATEASRAAGAGAGLTDND